MKISSSEIGVIVVFIAQFHSHTIAEVQSVTNESTIESTKAVSLGVDGFILSLSIPSVFSSSQAVLCIFSVSIHEAVFLTDTLIDDDDHHLELSGTVYSVNSQLVEQYSQTVHGIPLHNCPLL
jgi:hypothetical protein